eukprot:CAMPEP_0115517350 /NCGR_PEP_ID=MMETSP0271-20121206/77265_1 /TAXON_ID=71861 /ORGANISM="Scrippsiella trochoidea, Strain CCMP3099" /LENGTH=197 /DNA_ID=CAMNT_0002948107 /DNA_START=10 /DNA_END=599 /DNA_ORIENTATION=+
MARTGRLALLAGPSAPWVFLILYNINMVLASAAEQHRHQHDTVRLMRSAPSMMQVAAEGLPILAASVSNDNQYGSHVSPQEARLHIEIGSQGESMELLQQGKAADSSSALKDLQHTMAQSPTDSPDLPNSTTLQPRSKSSVDESDFEHEMEPVVTAKKVDEDNSSGASSKNNLTNSSSESGTIEKHRRAGSISLIIA